MWWPSSERSTSCWEKWTGRSWEKGQIRPLEKKVADECRVPGNDRVLEAVLGAAALWRGGRRDSAAGRRLHRVGGAQNHGGPASAAGTPPPWAARSSPAPFRHPLTTP